MNKTLFLLSSQCHKNYRKKKTPNKRLDYNLLISPVLSVDQSFPGEKILYYKA